ncbi:MAG: PAS domain-containing protein, partial [Proteobacteria bacterium]|nr:PAS domain-containing protein [Pseudomonadota bacterium]
MARGGRPGGATARYAGFQPDRGQSMSGTPDELFRRTADSAPIGMVLVDATDPALPLVYANPEFCNLCGYPLADLVGRNLRFLQGEDREQDARHRLRESL